MSSANYLEMLPFNCGCIVCSLCRNMCPVTFIFNSFLPMQYPWANLMFRLCILEGSSGTDQSRYAWSVQVSQFVVNGLAQLHGHEFIQMIIRTSPEKEVLFYRKISAMSLVDATRANGLQLLADYYQQLVNNR